MKAYFQHPNYDQRIIPYYFAGLTFDVYDPKAFPDVLRECEEWKEKNIWKYRREGYELYDISISTQKADTSITFRYSVCFVEKQALFTGVLQTQTADTISPNLHGKAVCFSE